MLDGHLDGEIAPFTVPARQDDDNKSGRINVRQIWRRPWRQSSRPARQRVFIYSHDTFGLGHLRRNLAIAEHLLGRDPGFEVLLITGSPVIRSWDLPPGLSVQPLPPVVKVGPESYAARAGNDPFAMVKGYREALILKSVLRGRPDVVLVDHAPAGMRGELLPTLSLMRRELPATRVAVGLRDILDSPEVVRKLWHEEDTYALLDRAYHDIFVYGSRELFDLAPAYGIPETTAAKLRYVGHIGRPLPTPGEPDRTAWPGNGVRVLVTAGGGGDGMFLMDAYLRALKMVPPRNCQSLLVTGPLMPSEHSAALYAHAVGRADVTIRSHTTDLPRLMADADLVISMGGYNTCVEILAARKKAIIVPRAGPRAEQLMRAATLEKLGLTWTAAPGPDLAERLAQLLPEALADRRARPPAWEAIDLNGACRVGDLLSSGVGDTDPTRAFAAADSASSIWNRTGPLAYVVKRYPRLSETFILNEIRAMERLGYRLHIFTLLPPEPPPHHPAVAEVQASVSYLPVALPAKLAVLARSHTAAFVANPVGYVRAFGHALRLMVETPNPLSSVRQFLRAGFFAGVARQLGITHLHAHFASAPAAVAQCLSMMTRLPFSFTAHAKDIYLTPTYIVRQRIHAAEFVATCTGYNADFLRGIVAEPARPKINLIYHGIDLSLFRYRAPGYRFLDQGTEPLILSVGRLVPKKGLDDLIAACAALAARGLRFRCEIVGHGPLREQLAADIAARGLMDRITLRGAMTHADLIEKFALSDIFVLAPRITENGDRDGIPNVIVEAMATGVPVVSSLVSGIPEMVVDNETGLLVAPRDPAGLADAMERLLSDPALGRRLAANARARVDHSFDCWQTTRELGALIEQCSPCCATAITLVTEGEVA